MHIWIMRRFFVYSFIGYLYYIVCRAAEIFVKKTDCQSLLCRRKMRVAALLAFFCEGSFILLDRNGAIHIVGSAGFVLYKAFLGSSFECKLRLGI